MKRFDQKKRNAVLILKQRRGSLTFVELMVSFLVASICAVAVASGIYIAHGTILRERHKAAAVQILKGEMNYWQGRIHSAFPAPLELVRPDSRDIIVYEDPIGRDIRGRITRDPIDWGDDPETALNPDWYEIRIELEYDEDPLEPRWLSPNAKKKTVVLELVSPMIVSTT